MSADISQVTDNLFLASHLDETHIEEINQYNIKLLISMVGQREPSPHFGPEPFEVLWLKSYDTFLTPVPMRKLKQGVEAALPVIKRNKNVLVFCHQGKRRSVTMAASILIACGYSASDAVDLLKEKREVIIPVYWYVKRRIKKFERFWLNNKS